MVSVFDADASKSKPASSFLEHALSSLPSSHKKEAEEEKQEDNDDDEDDEGKEEATDEGSR